MQQNHLLSFVISGEILAEKLDFPYIRSVMKSEYYISRQFQDDLIDAYNSVAPTCFSQLDAYRKAVKQPAPRYYVSARQAAQVISPMVRGDFERVDMMRPNRRRMYYCLFEKVMELSEKRAFIGKPLLFIMRSAVSSPAPEFFVGFKTLARIRSYLKNGHLDDEGRVINMPTLERNYEKLKKRRAELKAYREQFKSSTQ